MTDALSPGEPLDLLGHSMDGNVVMSYAGVRAARVRRLGPVHTTGRDRVDSHDRPDLLAAELAAFLGGAPR